MKVLCISCRSFELLDFQEISTSKFNMGARPPLKFEASGARARARVRGPKLKGAVLKVLLEIS